ncbi:HNH endonuclease [Clavibacter capsici]|nr:HNH endonuclease [Clavibacter capsici]
MDVTKLWVLFDKACAYCGTPTPLDLIHPEHVVAISRGGANNTTNLLPSCNRCNGDKRDLSLAAWAESRVARGLTPVTTTWDEGDPRYKHLVITPQIPLKQAA